MLHILFFLLAVMVVYGLTWLLSYSLLRYKEEAHIPAIFLTLESVCFFGAVHDSNMTSSWLILERFDIVAYALLILVGIGWSIFQLTNTDAREKWHVRSLKKKLKLEEERRYRQQLIAGLEESIDKLYERDLNEVLELTK